jgi:hypothetical protein
MYIIDANGAMSILDSTSYSYAEDYSQEDENIEGLFLPIRKMNGKWTLAEGGHSKNFIDVNTEEINDTVPFPETEWNDPNLIVAKRSILRQGKKDKKGNYMKDEKGEIRTKTRTITKYYRWDGEALKSID